jgi:hypothetical protein
MPLFPKKPRDKKGAPATAPAWHPNFRNFERLPDTKTVRTSFFINAGAGFVTLSLLIWTGYGEYRLHNVRAEIAKQEASIEKDQPGSDAAVKLNGKFQEEEKKLRELEQFTQGGVGGGKVVFSKLLLRLSQTRPPKIALSGVEGSQVQIALRGTVSGSLVEAAKDTDVYLKLLQADPEIAPLFESILISSQSPDNTTGRLAFEIALRFKEPPKPAAPKENKEAAK